MMILLTRTPNTLVAVATRPLPVPRSLAGNTSGETAYKTPYMIYVFHIRSSVRPEPQHKLRTHITKEGIPVYVTRHTTKFLSPKFSRKEKKNSARNSPAVPPQQRIRAPGGGSREEKDTREPYLTRGVVE